VTPFLTCHKYSRLCC